jgi:signal transduction histidine kinase
MPLMDLTMEVSIFICYLINENGRHKLARIVLLSFLNIFFFVYSSLAHHGLGIYMYYFAWVGLAAVVFEINENFYRFFFIGLSIVLTIILFATDFNVFGKVMFDAIDLERSFIINFVSSITVLVFFIVFMVNMNEQSENKLISLASEIKTKNTELEKANRELDRFFYSASHDLKIPLMDIKGAINTALAENKNEEVLAYFEVLKERAQTLDNFLLDIIDYARNSQTGLRLEAVNIEALVDDVIRNFAFTKDADKIKFQTDVNCDYLVETDRVRLIVILNNIISNAIKYHSLEKRDPWINIQAYYRERKLTLIISDNGQGIDEELLPKIFDMFFRGTNQSKGSGLGLYIVKETVERMAGDVSVLSDFGKGTIFTLTIPATLTTTPVVKRSRVTVL